MKRSDLRVEISTLGRETRTLMEKVRSGFISSTTSTKSTWTVAETMPKAVDSKIIQVNTQLGKKLKTKNI